MKLLIIALTISLTIGMISDWKTDLSHVDINRICDEVAGLLLSNPPDLVVPDQPTSEGYSFHQRCTILWPYICITKHWVDVWAATIPLLHNQCLSFVFKAILKATIVHELVHWIQTLVHSQNLPCI
jgi:hypothetical protein